MDEDNCSCYIDSPLKQNSFPIILYNMKNLLKKSEKFAIGIGVGQIFFTNLHAQICNTKY